MTRHRPIDITILAILSAIAAIFVAFGEPAMRTA
jgi:hypothetical protein